jgi:pyruvate dehydrogenase E2 component (dihydrolipoamide acetyltransferase)
MQSIVVLKVSENMADATVGKWFVSEGDSLQKGDLVVELITEKATFEIEADQDGFLLKQYASSKSILPIGFTVAVIGDKDEPVPPDIEDRNNNLLSSMKISLDEHGIDKKTPSGPGIKATPAARRKARAEGIQLVDLRAALGIEGVISEKHVDEYIKREKSNGE